MVGFSRYPYRLMNYGPDGGDCAPGTNHRRLAEGHYAQYTSKGAVPGYEERVGLNRLMPRSTLDELRLGGELPPAPGYGPPWRLRPEARCCTRASAWTPPFSSAPPSRPRTGGTATIRGTARRPLDQAGAGAG